MTATTTTRWDITNIELGAGLGTVCAETADLAVEAFYQGMGFSGLADAAAYFLSTPEAMRAELDVQPARTTGECWLRAHLTRRAESAQTV